MLTWQVRVSFTASEPFEEDTPFEVSERLEDYSAVLSVTQTLDSGHIAMTIDAPTLIDASQIGIQAAASALNEAGVCATLLGIHAQTPNAFQQDLNSPVYPRVVGYAEVAELAGVSRQRARQFADKPSFPKPVILTAQGPLYNFHAIQQWLSNRHTNHTSA